MQKSFSLLLAVFAASTGFNAAAQTYPTKPIRLVVGFSPGGSADVTARLLAQRLAQTLGQAVIVENRPGASGAIANERVAKSLPDGYTLLAMGTSATVLPSLRAKLPYSVERDLAPISVVALTPFVLVVHPSVPARNVKELIALARAQPGKLNYGSVGVGSPPFIMGELFKQMAKVEHRARAVQRWRREHDGDYGGADRHELRKHPDDPAVREPQAASERSQ